jgi:hypothetical protein
MKNKHVFHILAFIFVLISFSFMVNAESIDSGYTINAIPTETGYLVVIAPHNWVIGEPTNVEVIAWTGTEHGGPTAYSAQVFVGISSYGQSIASAYGTTNDLGRVVLTLTIPEGTHWFTGGLLYGGGVWQGMTLIDIDPWRRINAYDKEIIPEPCPNGYNKRTGRWEYCGVAIKPDLY